MYPGAPGPPWITAMPKGDFPYILRFFFGVFSFVWPFLKVGIVKSSQDFLWFLAVEPLN